MLQSGGSASKLMKIFSPKLKLLVFLFDRSKRYRCSKSQDLPSQYPVPRTKHLGLPLYTSTLIHDPYASSSAPFPSHLIRSVSARRSGSLSFFDNRTFLYRGSTFRASMARKIRVADTLSTTYTTWTPPLFQPPSPSSFTSLALHP